jgi:hypothetical protein
MTEGGITAIPVAVSCSQQGDKDKAVKEKFPFHDNII